MAKGKHNKQKASLPPESPEVENQKVESEESHEQEANAVKPQADVEQTTPPLKPETKTAVHDVPGKYRKFQK